VASVPQGYHVTETPQPLGGPLRLSFVRRISSLVLYVVGYGLIALFDGHTALLPAVASFCAGNALLVRFSDL
jgi:hypothetical protein